MPTQEVPVERTGVEPIDWSQVVSQMNRYLRIKQTAVAVQYFKTKEEILQIPKVRIPTRHIAPCTTISQAVQFNWTVACLPETIHINYCRGIHGMYQRDDKWHSGKIFDKVYYENLCDAKAHHDALGVPAGTVRRLRSNTADFWSPARSRRLHNLCRFSPDFHATRRLAILRV